MTLGHYPHSRPASMPIRVGRVQMTIDSCSNIRGDASFWYSTLAPCRRRVPVPGTAAERVVGDMPELFVTPTKSCDAEEGMSIHQRAHI